MGYIFAVPWHGEAGGWVDSAIPTSAAEVH